MKHIIITAGGTTETIDGVRKISNTSTGSLCACIYEALAAYLTGKTDDLKKSDPAFMVHYVVGDKAVRPKASACLPVTFYPVTDVKSVESVLEKLLREYRIDCAIHGMAVSDFTKGYLIKQEALLGDLANALEKALKSDPLALSGAELKKLIRQTLDHPASVLSSSDKVSSQYDLFLSLNRTPKLIEKFKKLNPDIFLVGFKLLKDMPEEKLIQAASTLTEKNGCDLVLANDVSKIHDGLHEGLLLKGTHIIGRYHTKKEIAGGIVEQLFRALVWEKG